MAILGKSKICPFKEDPSLIKKLIIRNINF